MKPHPLTLSLLATAVASLLLGPVVLLFVPLGNGALAAGLLLLIYGAIALWSGMKRLDRVNLDGDRR